MHIGSLQEARQAYRCPPSNPHRLISPPQRAGKLSKCCGHRVHWSPSWSTRKWSVATICRTIPNKWSYCNCSRTWHRWHPRFVMKLELHCVVYVLCFRFFPPVVSLKSLLPNCLKVEHIRETWLIRIRINIYRGSLDLCFNKLFPCVWPYYLWL